MTSAPQYRAALAVATKVLAGPLALGGGAAPDADDAGSLDLWLRTPIVAVREAEERDGADPRGSGNRPQDGAGSGDPALGE